MTADAPASDHMDIIEIPSPLGVLRLRPEQAADHDFRYQLFCDSRLPEWETAPLDPAVREQLMRHQFQAQTATYAARFPKARFDIIELDGQPIGRIVVNRPGTQLHLVDHNIVPALRNKGLGTAIMRALMDEARSAGIPFRLKVASSTIPRCGSTCASASSRSPKSRPTSSLNGLALMRPPQADRARMHLGRRFLAVMLDGRPELVCDRRERVPCGSNERRQAMARISRRTISKGLAASTLSLLARPALAQGAYPAGIGTIKLVVPYPAGGATDVIGRIVADRLSAMWHASVIVENIAGAAANIGMDRVAKGPTDGSTLFIVPPQIAINQYLYAKLAFDPEKDLVPIAQVASLPNILVVKKQLTEIKTVKDLIDYAKANPGKLNYASSGSGSTIHLSAELFKSVTGTEMNHIPYRGSAPAVNDLVGGQVDLMFDNATSIIGQVRGNTVTTLGVTSLKRSPLLPEFPAVAETVPGYDTASWFGIGVRAGVSNEIIEKIEQAAKAIAQEAVVKERMAAVIADPVVSDRKTFNEFIVAERQKWGSLIKNLNLRVE